MQFFTWGISQPDVKERRTALIERHWDYIADFEEALIARGPVLDPDDLSSAIGSIHVFESEDWDSARDFVFNEPFATAGLFEEVVLTRFLLESDHTQFEFVSKPDLLRFFVYCPARPGMIETRNALRSVHRNYLRRHAEHLVCSGSLLTDAGAWNGAVHFLEVPSAGIAEGFLSNEPYNRAGILDDPSIHRWTMGGRANLDATGALGT